MDGNYYTNVHIFTAYFLAQLQGNGKNDLKDKLSFSKCQYMYIDVIFVNLRTISLLWHSYISNLIPKHIGLYQVYRLGKKI